MAINNKINNKEDHKVLVFLHYFGGSKNSWKWVTDGLNKDLKCIALNLPGFGNSMALNEPSIKSFATYVQKELERLEIGAYVLVGHSMGAKIAFQMAANDVDKKIEQLILVAPSPPGIEPIEKEEKDRMLNHPDLKEAETTVKNITKMALNDDQYKLAVKNNLGADNNTWNWWLNAGMNHSLENQMKGLKLKITILNSEDDPVITPLLIKERVLNIFPNAQLITTQNTGHLIPLENPHWVAEQIKIIVAQ